MNWLIFSVLSGLAFAISKSIARYYLRRDGNALAFTTGHDFLAGVILLPFIFYSLHFPSSKTTWILFMGATFFGFASDYLAFVALKLIDVSLYQITTQFRHVFALIAGLIFLSEVITLNKILAIFLIVLGVAIAVYKKSSWSWSRGVWMAALSTLSAVIAFVFIKFVLKDFSEFAFASFDLMCAGLWSFLISGGGVTKLRSELRINKFGILFAGIFFALFELFLILALKLGELSKVVPSTQVSLLFTVLLGFFVLKEREGLWQKILGMFMILAGIILLYFV